MSSSSSNMSYKEVKEAFVTGHTGCSMFELNAFLLMVALWMLLYQSMRRLYYQAYASDTLNIVFTWKHYYADFVFVVLPILASFTIFQSYIYSICIILSVVILFLTVFLPSSSVKSTSLSSSPSFFPSASTLSNLNDQPAKNFISLYRVSLHVVTVIAILAIDFPLFPRKFAKTETFGTGLMDIGVGAYIFAHALTSIHAKSNTQSNTQKQQKQHSQVNLSRFQSLLHLILSILPLLILGFARFFTVKATDYQVHSSEYGLHWNFFFTLGVTAVLSATIAPLLKPTHSAAAGFSLAVSYQGWLSYGGLTEYILNAPRVDFISANKEGIFSCIGYFALYLIAVQIGHYLLHPTDGKGWWKKVQSLMLVCIILWSLTYFSDIYIQTTSRRLLNLSYILWLTAMNVEIILFYLVAQLLWSWGKSSKSEDDVKEVISPLPLIVIAINRNSLPFFLLCNIVTGAVNLCLQTVYANDATAMVVLSTYLFVCCGVICQLHLKNKTIRLG